MIHKSTPENRYSGLTYSRVLKLLFLIILLCAARIAFAQTERGVTFRSVTPSAGGTINYAATVFNARFTGYVKASTTQDTVRRVELRSATKLYAYKDWTPDYSGELLNTERYIDLTAPLPEGTHNLYLLAYTLEEGGGQTQIYPVTVNPAPPPPTFNGAQVVRVTNPPATMTPGQSAEVVVRMRNTGTTTWTTAQGYKLGSQNPQDHTYWGPHRQYLTSSVAPNGEIDFNFSITAPSTTGARNFEWQMVQDGVAWFGQLTGTYTVQVQPLPTVPPPEAKLTSPNNGNIFTTLSSTATTRSVTVAGSATPSPGATISKLELFDGADLLEPNLVSTGFSKQRNFTVGSHPLRLKATDNNGNHHSSYATIEIVRPTNAAPTATITSPASGTTYTVPAGSNPTVMISGTGDDSDGTISKLEVVDDSYPPRVLGNANQNVTLLSRNGTQSLRLRATDNLGLTGLSSPIDIVVNTGAESVIYHPIAPTTTGGAVAVGGTLAAGINATVKATYGDVVTKIELREGINTIHATSGNYDWELEPGGEVPKNTERDFNKTALLGIGTHQIYLRAYTLEGLIGDSQVFTVVVTKNVAPTLSFISPAADATLSVAAGAQASLRLIGTAEDSDGTITSLQVLNGTEVRASSPNGALDQTVSLAIGTYNLRLVAMDNSFAEVESAIIKITVAESVPGKPVVTMTAPTTGRTYAAIGPTASVTVKGNATDSDGTVTKIDIFDNGVRIPGQPGLELDKTISLAPGPHRISLIAYDNAGNESDESTAANITVTSSGFLGTVQGIRVDAASVPHLVGWACKSATAQPLTYQVFVNASSAEGGTLIGSGVANLTTDSGNASVQAHCQTPGAGHHFSFNLAAHTSQHPGAAIVVQVSDGTNTVVLPCDVNNCTMPGSLRIGLTTPVNNDRYSAPATVFMRAQLSNGSGSYDEVAFNINGEWINGIRDTAVGAYYASKANLAASATPYIVFAKVRQGNTTLYTAEHQITVDASVGVTLAMTSPNTGATVAFGTPVQLSATSGGNTALVQSVKFYANGALIATGAKNGSVWTAEWTTAPVGSHVIYSRAFDGSSVGIAQSSVANIGITSGGGLLSATPVPVTITPPFLDNADAGTLPGDLGVSASGTATYSIDIAVPPGSVGMQPDISLNYNSSGTNGLLGLGWSVGGFSSIHRCGKTIAQDGINNRIAFDTTDRLCLDGQRLVLVNLEATDANYWADTAEYRTELESYSRITAQVTNGSRSFKVERKDGKIALYGATTKSYVQGFIKPFDGIAVKTGAQSWAINKISDRIGLLANFVIFEYEQDKFTGEHRPALIRYGKKGGTVAHAAVQFTYEARPDAWKRYIDETRNDLRSRIKAIKTFVSNDDTAVVANDATLVREYQLTYEQSPTSGRSMLTSVRGGARNPTTGSMEWLPATTFEWGKPAAGKSVGFESKGFWANGPLLVTEKQVNATNFKAGIHPEFFAFSDFDNDGFTDILEKRVAKAGGSPGIDNDDDNKIVTGTLATQYRYFQNTGSSSFVEHTYKLNTGKPFAVLETGDFDGDGALDVLAALDNQTAQICLSPLGRQNALGPDSIIIFTCTDHAATGGNNVHLERPYAVDVKGDGRTALYGRKSQNGSATLYIQNETLEDSAPPSVLDIEYKPDGDPEHASREYVGITQMVDFSGIGKPYDVRWSRPYWLEYYYDLDGSKLEPKEWRHLKPTISIVGFKMPLEVSSTGAMASYQYPAYSVPTSSAGAPYRFDAPHQGAGLSGDFNGSGYSSLAFGFVALAYGPNGVSWHSDAQMTVCLSTGRSLDCGVRQKYSGVPQYAAVRAVGNFVGDGQPRILTEKIQHDATPAPTPTGDLQMCTLTGDDTTNGGVNDANINCQAWPGVKLRRTVYSLDRVFFMDLLGTGRTQLVYYHAGQQQGTGPFQHAEANKQWEVFAPVDQAVTGQALDRIHQVTNGLGAVSSVEYVDSLPNGIVRQSGTKTSTYPIQFKLNPGKLVHKIHISNGISSLRSRSYRYEDPAFDVTGRGATGFGKVIMTDDQSGIVVAKTYLQQWPLVGSESLEQTTIGSTALSTVRRDFQSQSVLHPNGQATIFTYEGGSITDRSDLDGSDLGITQVTNAYDVSWGNLLSQEIKVRRKIDAANFTTSTVSSFQNTVSNWLIGLPTNVTVTKTNPDGVGVSRTVSYTYSNGLVFTETVSPGASQTKLVTRYHRAAEACSLVTRVEKDWTDPVTKLFISRDVRVTQYDSRCRFPVVVSQTVNNIVHSEVSTFSPGTGAQLSLVGPNNLETRWIADGFGRVNTEIRADGNETRTYAKQCGAGCPGGAAVVRVADHFNGASRTVVPALEFSDNVGHVLRTQTWGANGRATVTDQRYDSLGRLESADHPRFDDESAVRAVSKSYDDLSRVTATTTYDEDNYPRTTRAVYKGLITELTNARGFTKVETRNALGQLSDVKDANGKHVLFGYEPFGNLSKTTDPNGNVITVRYDDYGRKIELIDPNLGTINYTVDPLGQVRVQRSPKQQGLGQSTTMVYDELGRMTSRNEPDLQSIWVFDTATMGIGQLAEASTVTGTGNDYRRIHTYDALGRPKTTQQVLFDGLYKSTVDYDPWGRLIQNRYQRASDNEKIFDSRYDITGSVSQVQRGDLVLWRVSAEDAAGRFVGIALGNNLTQDRTYNRYSGRLEPSVLKTVTGQDRLNEAYKYDEIGNVKHRTQYWDTNGFQESFEYDSLNRLSSSTMLGQAPQIFTYDDAGNITSKTGVGSGVYEYPVQGAGVVLPHAVKSIPGIGNFYYDANGNLLEAADRKFTWTSFDMPVRITKGTVWGEFAYGTEHQRTRQTRSDGSVVVYAGAQEAETKGGQVTVKTYWPGGIGVEIDRPNLPTEMSWIHVDRLGSPVALTDESGVIREKLAYDVWGKRRALNTNATPDSVDGQIDNRGYTGHEMLDQLDLVHMNGRVYDPFVAKFISGDPLISDPLDGQNYSRYSYVLNNPTNATDPTGFQALCLGGAPGTPNCGGNGTSLTGHVTCTGACGPAAEDGSPGDKSGGKKPVKVVKDKASAKSPDANTGNSANAATGGLVSAKAATATDGSSLAQLDIPTVVVQGYRQAMTTFADNNRGIIGWRWAVGLVDTHVPRPDTKSAEGKVAGVLLFGAATISPGGAKAALGKAAENVKKTSKIDRAAFKVEREAFWKREAQQRASAYSPADLERMNKGRAPIGPDGHSMELHHVDRTPDGGLAPMSRTDHRLGPNYKLNHPDD